ncbi:MAG: hypothetical protein IRY84_04680 [Thermobispora bispora]|nr:hypothetical protein [Thermobispora bispora]
MKATIVTRRRYLADAVFTVTVEGPAPRIAELAVGAAAAALAPLSRVPLLPPDEPLLREANGPSPTCTNGSPPPSGSPATRSRWPTSPWKKRTPALTRSPRWPTCRRASTGSTGATGRGRSASPPAGSPANSWRTGSASSRT